MSEYTPTEDELVKGYYLGPNSQPLNLTRAERHRAVDKIKEDKQLPVPTPPWPMVRAEAVPGLAGGVEFRASTMFRGTHYGSTYHVSPHHMAGLNQAADVWTRLYRRLASCFPDVTLTPEDRATIAHYLPQGHPLVQKIKEMP